MTTAPQPARVPQSRIARVYQRIAPIYDVWAHLTEARARTACLDAAGDVDGLRVLEVAVGTGLVFAELVRRNPTGLTEGIDITPAMLERARAKVEGLCGAHRLRVGDARALDFADGSFDLLVSNYMFDLLPEADFAPILAEFHRALRPGGRMVLVNMARGDSLSARLWEWAYRKAPELLGGCRGVELALHVERAGFGAIARRDLTQLTFPSEVITATR
ncbi:MAG: class I SAM-dependent methyltransferase [Polyangiaceae bacterium]|nr:class I SAM-dependent methyltransferase [Polyangiaceae bacterium]